MSRRAAQRMTPAEARAYWADHEDRFSAIDWERDPDGLAGYLGPGQPDWINERFARLQRDVFARLIARVPGPAEEERALDIGCGAGRWTRSLAAHGYAAVGLDLQERIIAANRERFPEIEWLAMPLQDLPVERSFALVTSIGVLQAIPYAEQGEVIRRLGTLTAPGGHAIILEGLHHPSPNAFPHPAAGWAALFAAAGLELVEEIPFSWEPLRRAAAASVRAVRPSAHLTPDLPTEAAPIDVAQPAGAVWRGPRALRTVAGLDDRLEPLFQRLRPRRLQARWAGLLFRKP